MGQVVMARLVRSAAWCRVPELLARGWAWASDLQPEPKPWCVVMTRRRRPGETLQEAFEDMTR